jgi:hypothetical protein
LRYRQALNGPAAGHSKIISNAVDKRTKLEQNKNIKGIKELIMTAFARDLAAFVSMSLFVASFAVLAMAF